MSVTPLIQMVMLAAAALILLLAHVKATRHHRHVDLKSGMVAMFALFGIAWMADTFIANNEDAIVQSARPPRGELADHDRARGYFLVAALTTSRSAATRTMQSRSGIFFGNLSGSFFEMWDHRRRCEMYLPANGTQIAAAEAHVQAGCDDARQAP